METKYALRSILGSKQFVRGQGSGYGNPIDIREATLFPSLHDAVGEIRDRRLMLFEPVAVDITTTEGKLEEVPLPEGTIFARDYGGGTYVFLTVPQGDNGPIVALKRSAGATTYTVRELR